ncbi:MAG: hypothetical protein OXC63_13765 [Aestuariivita sp.]|nr:hypothetical protein [Aestuariivita sp.]MCY4347203.1 hypothetical protein [Aestuariivita sp.]
MQRPPAPVLTAARKLEKLAVTCALTYRPSLSALVSGGEFRQRRRGHANGRVSSAE